MAINVGTAPDSWGVWFPNHEKQTPWKRCMDEMMESNYQGVELGPWGYFPNTAVTLKPELESRGLELVAGTCGGNFLSTESVNKMKNTIDDMSDLLKNFKSAKYIVMLPDMYTNLETGEIAMNPVLDEEERKTYASNVQKVADYIVEKGYVACFHPHVDCHVQTEEEIEQLLKDTNENVQLCFDTGHHVYGGGEPISFYKRNSSRIPYIHIKDCDMTVKAKMDEEKWSFAKAVTENIMVEPGKGSIDFNDFKKALDDSNYEGWVVVEQDLFPVKAFDIPLQIAKRTRKFLTDVGF
ncbi:MAG: TIM barrel protein [Suipraeoptans sp.]